MHAAGYSLLSQLEKAVEMYKKHQAAFEQFNATFEPEVLVKWEQMVMAWDADITQPNPYEEPAIGKCALAFSTKPIYSLLRQAQPLQMFS